MKAIVASLIQAAYHRFAEPLRALRLKRARLAALGIPLGAELPKVAVDPFRNRNCSRACAFDPRERADVLGRYLDRPPRRGREASTRARVTPMVIELGRYPDFAAFERSVRARSSRTLPKARRALKQGYSAHAFPMRRHVHDIHAVKTSMRVRAGGPVVDYWLLRPEHVGRQADRPLRLKRPACPRHWSVWWGAFQSAPGHRQGALALEERLIAYVKLVRIGDIVHYADIMGHRDHLEAGVMTLIHLEIIRWLIESGDREAAGVRAVLYGGAEHGREGLLTWKRRAGFEPARLTLAPAAPT